jgi:hypothetical protein
MSTYFPSGCLRQRSTIVRTMPQPFISDMFSWAANSLGRIVAVLRTMWRLLSRGLAREI